jgi:hypothetical protein
MGVAEPGRRLTTASADAANPGHFAHRARPLVTSWSGHHGLSTPDVRDVGQSRHHGATLLTPAVIGWSSHG